jgi:hypothetical protein
MNRIALLRGRFAMLFAALYFSAVGSRFEGVKRMSTEGTQQSEWATFEELIPGCNWRLLKPFDEPIKAGIRVEQSRLSGKNWLVVARIYSMYWDMMHKEIFLDAALCGADDAWARAQEWQQELVAEQLAANGGACREPQSAEWPLPSKDEIATGPIRRLPQSCVYREYWDYNEIDVAVLPIDPKTSISSALLRIVDCDSALKTYFEKIGESLGFGVRRPVRKFEALPVRPEQPSRVKLGYRRWLPYLLAAAIGVALSLIFH